MSLLAALAGSVWDELADACLTNGRHGSVLHHMWLTDGDLAVDVAAIRTGVHPVPLPELPDDVTIRLAPPAGRACAWCDDPLPAGTSDAACALCRATANTTRNPPR